MLTSEFGEKMGSGPVDQTPCSLESPDVLQAIRYTPKPLFRVRKNWIRDNRQATFGC